MSKKLYIKVHIQSGHTRLHKTNMTERLQEVNHRVYNKTSKWNDDAIYFFVDDKDEQMIEEQSQILQEIKSDKPLFTTCSIRRWGRNKFSVRQA
jgi:hypothetical protein